MGRILLPPGGIGDGAAVAQEIALPVLAPTRAAILRLESANAAFQLVVGTRKVLPVIALHQVRTQVREHLQELGQASLFQFRERAIRCLLSQFLRLHCSRRLPLAPTWKTRRCSASRTHWRMRLTCPSCFSQARRSATIAQRRASFCTHRRLTAPPF